MAKIEGQVLLIGLGGTGSRIVNNVVSDLQKAARRKNKKFGVSRKKWAFRYSKIEKCGIMII